MRKKTVYPDDGMAYYHAAVGVVGYELGVEVRRLATTSQESIVPTPTLMPLDKWCPDKKGQPDRGASMIEDYVTVMLAGSSGRLLRAEKYGAYNRRCTTLEELAFEYQTIATLGRDRLTDRAFGITLAYLAPTHDEARQTVCRLWDRANELLHEERHRSQLDRLAALLQAKGELFWPEIVEVLKD